MQYNTDRPKMIMPEYGRYIQKLVNQCLTISDAQERNKMAQYIIAVMGYFNPHLRDVPDFQHKLWDQLFIMSNFQLDVDSPFEKPTPEKFTERPRKLQYPAELNRFRYYGHHLKTMIQEAINWQIDEKREALIYSLANQMKKSYLKWNKDTVEDSIIWKDLAFLSDNQLVINNPDPLIIHEGREPSNQNNGSNTKRNNKKYKKHNS